MFCDKCGAEMREGAEFCTRCGAKVEKEGVTQTAPAADAASAAPGTAAPAGAAAPAATSQAAPASQTAPQTASPPPPAPSKNTTKMIVIAIIAVAAIIAAVVAVWLIWGQNDPQPEALKTGGEVQPVTLTTTPPATTTGEADDTGDSLDVPDAEPDATTADSYLFQCTTDADYRVQIGPGDTITYIGPDGEWEIGDWQETEDGWIVHLWTDDELNSLGAPGGEVSEAYLAFAIDDQGTLYEVCSIVIDGQEYGWQATYTYVGPGE
jgi:hypothetical protein